MSYTTISIEGGLFLPDLWSAFHLAMGASRARQRETSGFPLAGASRRDAEEFLGCAQVLGRFQSAAGTLTRKPHYSDP